MTGVNEQLRDNLRRISIPALVGLSWLWATHYIVVYVRAQIDDIAIKAAEQAVDHVLQEHEMRQCQPMQLGALAPDLNSEVKSFARGLP